MNKKTIYLGGNITGLTFKQAAAPRVLATKLLEPYFNILDPMRDKTIMDVVGEDDLIITPATVSEAGIRDNDIVHRDLYDIRICDYLLWLTGNIITIGSCTEQGYAFALGKLIFTVSDTDFGPWQRGIATRIEPTIEQMCAWLIKFYQ